MKQSSIATALILGVTLSVPLSVPALSDAAPSNTAMQGERAHSFRRGDFVRLRSGGPLMIVERIEGNQVDCIWTSADGEPNVESFPVDVLQEF
jgi:uncharacterized protein YodC (DUF2158 family)